MPNEPFPLAGGHGDPPLHEHGHAQAELVAARLRDEPIDAIYVTTLQRTHQTAAPLAAALGMTPIIEPDLREVFLGEWEGGLLRVKAAARDPLFDRILAEQRWEVIPGAEPAAAFEQRVLAGLRRIAGAHPDQVVAAVVHGGVIGQILASASGSRPFAFSGADNGSISEIVVGPPPPKVVRAANPETSHHELLVVRRFNDTAHLRATTR